MTTLDKLINDAELAIQNTEDGSPERATAQAKLDGLTSVKDAGIAFTQADLNRIDKKAKDGYETSIRDVLGMTLDEAKEAIAGVEESLTTGEGEAPDKGDEGSPIERMTAALGERDQKINDLSENNAAFQRRVYASEVKNGLNDALRELGIEPGYLDPARRLAGAGEMVEAALSGNEPTPDLYKEKGMGIKELSPVWFESEKPANSSDDGIRVKPASTGPAIPPTQTPNGNQGLTDEQRLAASSSPFR